MRTARIGAPSAAPATSREQWEQLDEPHRHGEATVNATLDASSDGKKVAIEEEYKLLFKGSRWFA
jgi:hypothetical protein